MNTNKPINKPRWTQLDAFAMLNGISTWDTNYLNLKYVRLPGETNIELREKINRFHSNKISGASVQNVIKGLTNELLLDEYNMELKDIFILKKTPVKVSGNTSDFSVYVKRPTDTDYVSYSSSNYFVGDYSDTEWSRLLTIVDSTLPDKTYIKVIYNVNVYEEDKIQVKKYTDMSNPLDEFDIDFIYRKPYDDFMTSGKVKTNMIVAYSLNDVPKSIEQQYYNPTSKFINVAKPLLFYIRDIIDRKYRHRWKDVKNNNSIWDVHKDYGVGVIPSYYDYDISNNITYKNGVTSGESLYLNKLIQHPTKKNTWNPCISSGEFYSGAIKYSLLNSPVYEHIEITGPYNYIEMPESINIEDKLYVTTSLSSLNLTYGIVESYSYYQHSTSLIKQVFCGGLSEFHNIDSNDMMVYFHWDVATNSRFIYTRNIPRVGGKISFYVIKDLEPTKLYKVIDSINLHPYELAKQSVGSNYILTLSV